MGDGKFQKGHAPLGDGSRPVRAPKGLAESIRQAVGPDGRQLRDVMFWFAMGLRPVLNEKTGRLERRGECGAREQQDAVKWLGDRGFGKVAETLQIAGSGPSIDVGPEILEGLIRGLRSVASPEQNSVLVEGQATVIPQRVMGPETREPLAVPLAVEAAPTDPSTEDP